MRETATLRDEVDALKGAAAEMRLIDQNKTKKLREVEDALEQSKKEVNTLASDLNQKQLQEKKLINTEKKLADLKKAHAQLAKDVDSRVKASADLREKSLLNHENKGLKNDIKNTIISKFITPPIKLDNGPILSMFDKFGAEMESVKRYRNVSHNEALHATSRSYSIDNQKDTGKSDTALSLSALNTSTNDTQKYVWNSVTLYDDHDMINEEKFQDIVSQASTLAERAEKRIRKMQIGLSVVKHGLSPPYKNLRKKKNIMGSSKIRSKRGQFD